MKIALIGATGFVGSALREEALGRGHELVAIARRLDGLPADPRLAARPVDLTNVAALTSALRGVDVALVAVRYDGTDMERVLSAVREARVPRTLFIGGAGSLRNPAGVDLVDTPDFPALYKAEATAARAFLQRLRGETTLDWSYLSPSAALLPGPRTGQFRLGADDVLIDAEGKSHISVADLAVAALDEIALPTHIRRRFTAGY
ncbi:NAD-dependent epimerase/dehydratase family protein [Massilia arenosa]|uniref:NAD-dependent epimerase/dehydratase family protein n=1 Tax=Zemynaea arenosa TaxID=2561931 RepID=A0A4Y9SI07_9BURK|nr:NAD(P)H-binding protein [Massilia arenosa]TFW21251.1 NAD-dependent epimerase/dehydratase family protein [Massilia arenosa]